MYGPAVTSRLNTVELPGISAMFRLAKNASNNARQLSSLEPTAQVTCMSGPQVGVTVSCWLSSGRSIQFGCRFQDASPLQRLLKPKHPHEGQHPFTGRREAW